MLVEITDDGAENLLLQILDSDIDNIVNNTYFMFSKDKAEEERYSKELLRAMKIVRAYHTIGGDVMGEIDGNN